MNTVIVKKASVSRIDCNSMYENNLSNYVSLNSLYSTCRGIQIDRKNTVSIPNYLGYDIDVKQTSLYKYLNSR